MPAETLLSAARRASNYFSIDMAHGGIITRETELAFDLLRKELERATRHIKTSGQLTLTYPDIFDSPWPGLHGEPEG